MRSILESKLLKTMFDLPSQENVEEIIIDAGAVKGLNEPFIIYSKEAITKIEKPSAAYIWFISDNFLLQNSI